MTSLLNGIRTVINTLRGSLFGASRSYYKGRALDANRSEGERPYESLSDEEVKRQYVLTVSTVRDADEGGIYLSPVIDRGWNLENEWDHRGNDPTELDEALREAGYDVQ